jgi:hypothetical protein
LDLKIQGFFAYEKSKLSGITFLVVVDHQSYGCNDLSCGEQLI